MANRENDTCFLNGLVMGLADFINHAALVKTLEMSSKRKLGPLQDTLQAGDCITPPFRSLSVSQTSATNNSHVPSLQFLPMDQYGLCFGYSASAPFTQRSHNRQVTSYGAISVSL